MKLDAITDAELWQMIKKNPEQGLKRAIQLYGGAVKTICRNIIGQDRTEDVEECMSEVFFQLWKNSQNYNSQYPLKNYIYGVARYTALDYRNRLLKKGQSVSTEIMDVVADLDIAEQLITETQSQTIYQIMGEMPFPDREIFLYRYYFGFSITEIADSLKLTYKAVESRLYRGKEKLRTALLERGIFPC